MQLLCVPKRCGQGQKLSQSRLLPRRSRSSDLPVSIGGKTPCFRLISLNMTPGWTLNTRRSGFSTCTNSKTLSAANFEAEYADIFAMPAVGKCDAAVLMSTMVAVGLATGRKARTELNAPRMFVSNAVHHSLGSDEAIVAGCDRKPALWTRRSSGLSVCCRTCLNADSRLENEIMSPTTATNLVLGYADSYLALVSSRVFLVRPTIPTTAAPAFARALTCAEPMVPAPPDTIADLPFNESSGREGSMAG